MSIITISRELAALGDETAKELARELGFRLVDREALNERIAGYDIANANFKKYDEKRPAFLASISEERDDYLHCLKSSVIAEALAGNCIIIGRGAFAMLEGVPDVVPIFLVSPMRTRLERVKSYFRCDEKRAGHIIEQSDNNRAGFHKFFFEKNWKDAENYQITLNTGFLHPQTSAELIKNYIESISCEENAEECKQKLHDMTLARDVVHHIRYEKAIGVHFLDATVENGIVELYGVANSTLMADAASAAAKEVPGVVRVLPDIQVVQEYSLRPYKI
jgi:cytidylate kinase